MSSTKRKVSVSLDQELVAELEAGGEALSSQVNEAVRRELARRRRHQLLDEMLHDFEQAAGPPDEATVARCVAAAVESGGGVIVTGDRPDLERLAAPDPIVQVAII